jgi:hypothetical protein
MGFPDHPSDQGRQAAPNMHVSPEHQGPEPDYPAYPQGPGFPDRGTGGYQAGYPMAGPARRANRMSVAALVCGLAQFVLWFILLVPGFIAAALGLTFGLVALSQIGKRGESGRGMAIAGVVLGGLGVAGGIVLGILIAISSGHVHAHMGY